MRQLSEPFHRPGADRLAGGEAARQDAAPPAAQTVAQTGEPAAIFSGPGPILWAGVGTVLFVMLVVFILLLRGRASAASRRAHAAGQHFFEPAGEAADISFDEPAGAGARKSAAQKGGGHRLDFSGPEEVEAEVVIQRDAAARALDPYRETAAEKDAAPKGGRFSGLFARASAPDRRARNDDAPAPAPAAPVVSAADEEDRRARELEESRRRFEEERARRDAEREAEFERRKRAALERAEEERAAPARAGSGAVDFGVEALRRDLASELDRRFGGLETRLVAVTGDARRLEEVERGVNDLRRDLARELDRRFEGLERDLAAHAAGNAREAETLERHAETLRGDLAAEIDRRMTGLEQRLAARPAADEQRLAALLRDFDARLSAFADNIESRLLAQPLANGGGAPADAGADTLARRLGEHRDSINAALAALTARIDAVAGPHEDMAAIRREMGALKRALGDRASGPSAPLIQLADIVRNALPPDFIEMRAALANNRRADCLVRLPHPPGPIAIDARFPVEAFHQLRVDEEKDPARAENEFRRVALRHIVDVAERLIVPEETAESALLFIPSESMYAELHARFPDVVQDGYRARVWIVSPTTLMAALHTIRAVLRDAQARESADLIHAEAQHVLAEVEGLRRRVIALEEDFNRARHDMRDVISSTDQVYRRAETITNSRRALAEGAFDRGSRHIPKAPEEAGPQASPVTPTAVEDDEEDGTPEDARPFPLR